MAQSKQVFELSEEAKLTKSATDSPGKALNFIVYDKQNGKPYHTSLVHYKHNLIQLSFYS